MRAITPQEYSELLDWAKENCGFYNFPRKNKNYKIVKYIESSYDTRTGKIWRIGMHEHEFSIRDDLVKDGKTIADAVKEYLTKK